MKTLPKTTAWEYAQLSLKTTQHFNRTHPNRLDMLGFEHKTNLEEGLTKMWEWAQYQPNRKRFVWENFELDKGIYSYWKNEEDNNS